MTSVYTVPPNIVAQLAAIPTKGAKYPFATMEVGEAFNIKLGPGFIRARKAMYAFAARNDKRFQVLMNVTPDTSAIVRVT